GWVCAALAAGAGELADPARLPIRLNAMIGSLTLDLQVVAIRNKEGVYTGAMAVWSDISAKAKLADAFEATVKAAVDDLAGEVSRLRLTAGGAVHTTLAADQS